MTNETRELVERLRNNAAWARARVVPLPRTMGPDADEAAAALQSLSERNAVLEARGDQLEELLDEAEDLCVALAQSMDLALVAAGDDVAPFVTERANKSTEALREFCGRASRLRSQPTLTPQEGKQS